MKALCLVLFLIANAPINAQIYETEVAIGLLSGEEIYGTAKIPGGMNKSINLTFAEDLPQRIILPQEIEYIIVDILITSKERIEGKFVNEDKRLEIVPMNIGDDNKEEWVYAIAIINGHLSYYAYGLRVTNPNNYWNQRNRSPDLIGTNRVIRGDYTFSKRNYFYQDINNKIFKASRGQAAYLKKYSEKLMSDCPNLTKEIAAKKSFNKEDVKAFILRYNQGCF